jgi:hypothetical protein
MVTLPRLTSKSIGQRLLNYEKNFITLLISIDQFEKNGVSKGNTLSRLTSKPI